jgi:hypothetical protein
MQIVTADDIRASFINCSKGEAERIWVPRDLAERPWGQLDFLGWRDPGAPQRNYIVAERECALVGVALRSAPGVPARVGMCSLCLTTHPGDGVSLMTAHKAGESGRRGNSVGIPVCTDLDCSLYVRQKKRPMLGGRLNETLSIDEQIRRVRHNLLGFIASVEA